MDFRDILSLSFDTLKERKVRSALTIVMVMVGSSLLVAVNGIGAGFSAFFNEQSKIWPQTFYLYPARNKTRILTLVVQE
jgi:putative ABC transport system permease protein